MKQVYIKPIVISALSQSLMNEGHITTISGGKVTEPPRSRHYLTEDGSWDVALEAPSSDVPY